MGRLVVELLGRVLPKRSGLLLYSFPDAAEQCTALHACLRRAGSDARVTWMVEDGAGREALDRLGLLDARTQVVRRGSWRGVWSYARHRNVVYTHGVYGNPRPGRDQVVVNVWHGMPIKTIGTYDPRDVGRGRPATFTVATSAHFRSVMARAMSVPEPSVRVVGNPRSDYLVGRDRADDLGRLGIDHERWRRIVAYLPTYRSSSRQPGRVDGQLAADVLDGDARRRLNEVLVARDVLLVAKPHPAAPSFSVEPRCSNIRVLTEADFARAGVGLYGFLGHVDALVTDVSSVMLDYLHVDRPVVVYFPDMDAYRDTRAFVLEPFEDWAPGPVARTVDQLLEELDQVLSGRDDHAQRRRRVNARVNEVPAGRAAAAVLSLLELSGG